MWYSRKFNSFGKNSNVNGRITLIHPERINIGSGTSINEGVVLGGAGRIWIGNNVRISPLAQLHTGVLDDNRKRRKHIYKAIVIKDNVWIASGAVIGQGVTIEENSTIGANVVVTKNIPPNTKYYGRQPDADYVQFFNNILLTKT